MNQGRQNAKKSVYLFLSCLLGSLMFLVIHRIIMFGILIWMAANGGLGASGGYIIFLALDYLTLIFFILFGGWYGIWLGIDWYNKVYEEGQSKGVLRHLKTYLLSKASPQEVRESISAVEEDLEESLAELKKAERELREMPVVNIAVKSSALKPKAAVRKARKKPLK